MMAAPETPRSKRRGSLLQGARALLTGKSTSDLDVPETPRTRKSKKVSSEEPLSTSRRSKSPVKNRTTLKEPDCPSTPQANRKVRRNSLGGSGHRHTETTATLNDSEQKVSPTPSKTKTKRRKSLGSLADNGKDDASSKSRSLKSPKPKKKSSSSSESKKTPLKRTSNHKADLDGSMNDLLMHLGDEPLPMEESTKKKREPSSPKSRSTVDRDGRIRRVKKKSGGNDSDGEDAKSTSSKRSKGSVKSLGSKKVKKARDKVDVQRRASLAAIVTSPRAMNNDSEHSDRGNRVSRTEVSARSGERRAGRRVLSLDSAGQLGSPLPDAKSFVSHTSEITTDTNSLSNVEFSSLPSPANGNNGKFTDHDLRARIAELEKQLTDVKEEHLKAQFEAQTEAAKLRKDLREEKLELQRSQTERRELRAELKEREALLDLSDRKIEALEKAVESQLDKVDDLEEELRRANEEVFYMEEKLAQAELDLVDSSAAEVQGLEKELALGDELRERTERRLVERERALEAREKKLREERDAMLLSSQPQRDVDRLEQDNRMLLKALNREKEEAAERQEQMQKTIDELKNTLLMSQNGSDGGLAELLQEKLALQEELDAVREEAREKQAVLENNSGSPRAGSMNGGSHDVARELDAVKAELEVLKSKNEASQRRNQLLEEDIDHWKSVNCNLEDELVEWKSQANNWRAKYENVADAEHLDDSQDLAPGILPYHVPRDSQSVKDHRDMDETASVASEPSNSIASLWSKLTTPSARRPSMSSQGMDPEQVKAVLARSTFH